MDNKTEIKIAVIGIIMMIIIYYLAWGIRREEIGKFRFMAMENDVSSADYDKLTRLCEEGARILFYSPKCNGCLAAGRMMIKRKNTEDLLFYDITSDLADLSGLPLEFVPSLMKMINGRITFYIGFDQIRKELGK
ncbi:MAG: hypothetical protein IJM15_08675 [Erysipelotrichaceae bacterium]|nr:hypothetical protein [Erysipelotrichaceae bacterium]